MAMKSSLIQANALQIPLADKSVHCIVTSPPYWSLRDYGIPGQLGLEPLHDCLGWATGQNCGRCYVCNLRAVFGELWRVLRDDGTVWLNIGDSYSGGGRTSSDTDDKLPERMHGFRPGSGRADGIVDDRGQRNRNGVGAVPGLKPKDLCMIPARVALALQADGWYLRSDCIWSKPNPMPESVTDRPTKAHEYLFLLAKNEKYFYDAEAVREENAGIMPWGDKRNFKMNDEQAQGRHGKGMFSGGSRDEYIEKYYTNGRNRRTVWEIATAPYSGAHFATYPPALVEPCIKAGTSERGVCPACGAPWKRVVENGTVVEHPERLNRTNDALQFDAKHNEYGAGGSLGRMRTRSITGWQPTCTCFAAGALEADDLEIVNTPTGERSGDDPSFTTGRAGFNRPRGDGEGQRPMTRYEQRRYAEQLRNSPHRAEMARQAGSAFDHYTRTDRSGARPVPPELLDGWIEKGWLDRVYLPEHKPLDPVPATILDPFSGSGTTVAVAQSLGRRGIGLDLSAEYLQLARQRTGIDAWEAWTNGKRDGANLADLPMFANKE